MKIINVMASSIDGLIGLSEQESDEQRHAYGFTNMDDREFVRSQLLAADAVITGAQSMRASRSAWSQKNAREQFPHWYVLSRRGLEAELEFWRQRQIPRTVVLAAKSSAASFPDPLVGKLVATEDSIANAVVEDAKCRGYETVLLFGGGQINNLFYQAGLVDEIKLTVCPRILGRVGAPHLVNPGLEQPVSLELLSSHVSRSHVFLHYRIQKNA